jgi:hypothetical protein
MSVETPNRLAATGIFAPVPAAPFVEQMVSTKGVRRFTRNAAGQYIIELEQAIAFEEGYAVAILPPNVQGVPGAQILPDGTVFVSALTLATGVPFDPAWIGVSVFRWNEGEGVSIGVPQPPVPAPIPPGGGGSLQDAYDTGPNATINTVAARSLLVFTPSGPTPRLLITDDFLGVPGQNFTVLSGNRGVQILTDAGAAAGAVAALDGGPISVIAGDGGAGNVAFPAGAPGGSIIFNSGDGGAPAAAGNGGDGGWFSLVVGDGAAAAGGGNGGNGGGYAFPPAAGGNGAFGGRATEYQFFGAGPGGNSTAPGAPGGQGSSLIVNLTAGGTSADGPGGQGGLVLFTTGQGGDSNSAALNAGGQGGTYLVLLGAGGNATVGAGPGGQGGSFGVAAGAAGISNAGPGGQGGIVQFFTGLGGAGVTGGSGGTFELLTGAGGPGGGAGGGGDGGPIAIQTGPGAIGGTAGGAGGNVDITLGQGANQVLTAGGTGGSLTIVLGPGGSSAAGVGGTAGTFTINGAQGGDSVPGPGGGGSTIDIHAGNGGGGGAGNGGAGGALLLAAGHGALGALIGGAGGSVSLAAGHGGLGATTGAGGTVSISGGLAAGGTGGDVTINPGSGAVAGGVFVGIGTTPSVVQIAGGNIRFTAAPTTTERANAYLDPLNGRVYRSTSSTTETGEMYLVPEGVMAGAQGTQGLAVGGTYIGGSYVVRRAATMTRLILRLTAVTAGAQLRVAMYATPDGTSGIADKLVDATSAVLVAGAQTVTLTFPAVTFPQGLLYILVGVINNAATLRVYAAAAQDLVNTNVDANTHPLQFTTAISVVGAAPATFNPLTGGTPTTTDVLAIARLRA